jgi:hypothetical protein
MAAVLHRAGVNYTNAGAASGTDGQLGVGTPAMRSAATKYFFA